MSIFILLKLKFEVLHTHIGNLFLQNQLCCPHYLKFMGLSLFTKLKKH